MSVPFFLRALGWFPQLKSLGLPLSPASLASIPRFSPVVEAPTANGTPGVAGTPGDAGTAGAPPEGAKAAVAAKLEKTGLGSSAAMTAAVCSALLAYWGVVRPEPSGECGRKATSSLTARTPTSCVPLRLFVPGVVLAGEKALDLVSEALPS